MTNTNGHCKVNMKVLLINGSPNEHGCTYTALSEVAASLQKHGVETELLYLGKKPVAGCIACGKCGETGKCIFEDLVNTTAKQLDNIGCEIIFVNDTKDRSRHTLRYHKTSIHMYDRRLPGR